MILGGDVLSGEKPSPFKVRIVIDAGQDNNFRRSRGKRLSIGFDVDDDRNLDYNLTFDSKGNLVELTVPIELTKQTAVEKWSRFCSSRRA